MLAHFYQIFIAKLFKKDEKIVGSFWVVLFIFIGFEKFLQFASGGQALSINIYIYQGISADKC